RDRRVTDKKQPRKNAATDRESRRQFLIIESERLKKAGRTVAQMKREKKQPDDVKTRHVDVLKTVNHHRINIVAIQWIELEQWKLRIEFAAGEMEQVKNNECEDDQSAHHHVPRSPTRFDIISLSITYRT